MLALRLLAIGDVLSVDEAPDPRPGDDEVVVDIAFAAVNPLDVWVMRGDVGTAATQLPWTPGTEATGFLDGTPVFVRGGGIGTTRQGTCRQRAAVPKDTVRVLPHGVDLTQVTALGVAGITAWNSLHARARVGPDDRVLVLGATGGVGSVAVRLARLAGATVWGQTGSAAKAGAVPADRVVVADADGLVAAVADLRPTVVLDPLGGAFTAAAVDALEPGGRLVVYGTSADPMLTANLRTFYRKGLVLHGYAGLLEPVADQHAVLDRLIGLLTDGSLRVPTEVIPLERSADAHQRLMDRRVRGRLLIDCRASGGAQA